MKQVAVSHRHGSGGVAVVGAAEGDQLVFGGLAAMVKAAHRHLDGHLKGGGTGIAVEDLVEPTRCDLAEAGRQFNARW